MRVDWPQCLGEYLDVCWGHNEGSDLWTCNTTAVANQYCRLLGFNSASQVGAGALSPDGGRTRYISDGGACGTEAGGCSALTFVVCSMGPPGPAFEPPTVDGIPLDWCLSWATDCGEEAALSFCHSQGYGSVAAYKKDSRPATATYNLGAEELCRTGQRGDCIPFASITCFSAPPARFFGVGRLRR